MSAKLTHDAVRPPLETRKFGLDERGHTVPAAASPVPRDHERTTHATTQVLAAQPILLRLPTVMRMTGLAKSTIYKLISRHQFPVPIKLSDRAVAWLQSEVESWVSSRVRAH